MRTTIPAGTSLFMSGSGAVNVDGFQWYFVYHDAVVGGDGKVRADGIGWIAGSKTDGTEQYIAWTSASCPDLPINAETLAGLSGWALESCETGTLSGLTGMLDQPIEGPVTPFTYDPGWLWFSPWYLTDPEEAEDVFLAAGWAVPIHFPPSIDTSGLRRGDLITVSGHINDPAAEDCSVSQTGNGPPVTDGAQQAFELDCRVKFVVDDFDITSHVELPET